jgi:hypothetical protein
MSRLSSTARTEGQRDYTSCQEKALKRLPQQVEPCADAWREFEGVEAVALVRPRDCGLGLEIEPSRGVVLHERCDIETAPLLAARHLPLGLDVELDVRPLAHGLAQDQVGPELGRRAGRGVLGAPFPGAGPEDEERGADAGCPGCYRVSLTTRSFSAWTGRALSWYSFENRAISSGETDTGCFSTYHVTPSLHGGVVSEPSKV